MGITDQAPRSRRDTGAPRNSGDAVPELPAGEVLTAPPLNELEDCQKFCAKHMRAPMPGTDVEREPDASRVTPEQKYQHQP